MHTTLSNISHSGETCLLHSHCFASVACLPSIPHMAHDRHPPPMPSPPIPLPPLPPCRRLGPQGLRISSHAGMPADLVQLAGGAEPRHESTVDWGQHQPPDPGRCSGCLPGNPTNARLHQHHHHRAGKAYCKAPLCDAARHVVPARVLEEYGVHVLCVGHS